MKYNAFQYLDDMRKAGVPGKQAEIIAKGMTEFAESELATKKDIELLQRNLKELELRLTVRLGGIMVLGVSVLTAIIKLA